MIEVIDRIPTYPGRVKLTPVAGQENTYDMMRADAPIEAGTPINKALFDSYRNKVNFVAQNVDNKLFELSQRVQVGSLANGAVFGLYENGVLTPYIKVNNTYHSQAYVLVVRLDIVTMMSLYDTSGTSEYKNSNIDRWLEGEFFDTLDTPTKSVISSVSVPIVNSNAVSTTISRKVFLLSNPEYGVNLPGGVHHFGVAVPYFNTADRRISRYEGTPSNYYSRSHGLGTNWACVILADGVSSEVVSEKTVSGVRPAFTLPAAYEVTTAVPSTANAMATAEVI